MATIPSRSDQYSKTVYSSYVDSFINMFKTLARAVSGSAQFNIILYNAFAQSYPIYLNTISEYNKSWKDLSESP